MDDLESYSVPCYINDSSLHIDTSFLFQNILCCCVVHKIMKYIGYFTGICLTT